MSARKSLIKLNAIDERVPDGDTVFEIGSITKVFTGILLAQAVLNGEVKLDDPISLYLPEGVTAPEHEGKSITLLDLAAHTSGLPETFTLFTPSNRCMPSFPGTACPMNPAVAMNIPITPRAFRETSSSRAPARQITKHH